MTLGANARGKDNLATVILALLFAVTVESVLSQVCGDLGQYNTLSEFWNYLRRAWTGDRARNELIAAQVVVFLLTLVRFYVGALRYCQETAGKVRGEALFAVIGTVLLFLGMYVTSRTVKTTGLFYWMVLAFHVLDLGWFFAVGVFLDLPLELSRIIHIWQAFDVITIAAIGLSLGLGLHPVWPLAAIVVIGAVDFLWFRRFYANKPDWVTATWFMPRGSRRSP